LNDSLQIVFVNDESADGWKQELRFKDSFILAAPRGAFGYAPPTVCNLGFHADGFPRASLEVIVVEADLWIKKVVASLAFGLEPVYPHEEDRHTERDLLADAEMQG